MELARRASPLSGPTVLLSGYYGFANTGDEAILTAILSGLTARAPSVSCIVVSGNPEQTRSQHRVDAVSWLDPAAIAEVVRRSDLVIIGGGGLFQDYWGMDAATLLTPSHYGVTFYAGPAVLAALAGKPLALHGLGFGPLASADARRFVRGVCDAASYISVRDAASRDLLMGLGVPAGRIALSADAAFCLAAGRVLPEDVLIGVGIEPRAPIVGVALRPWTLGVDSAVWEREIVAALDLFLEETGGTLLFTPFQRSLRLDEDDVGLALSVRQRLRHADRAAVLTDLREPAETAGLLSACDLVVAMRLHAAIFAVAGGVPTVGIAYDPKVRAALSRVGLGEFVEPLDGLSAKSLRLKMDRALSERVRLRGELTAAASVQRRLAERDMEREAAFLAAPPAAPPWSEPLRSLVNDALSSSLRRERVLAADLAALRAERESVTQRLGDLEKKERAAMMDLEERRLEVSRQTRQLADERRELSRIQTSRLWKTANLYWRARRAVAQLSKPARQTLARLRKAAPSDWVGKDLAHQAAAAAPPIEIDNRHDVVCFGADEPNPGLRRFAQAGHRVFRIAPRLRADGPVFEVSEEAPNLHAVSLRGRQADPVRFTEDEADIAFSAVDALRRERGLGATLSILEAPLWSPVAERLRRERAWPICPPAVEPAEAVQAFSKLSVVVVTYNNRDLNRLCLESLAARTEWPNLEIVAVDNASTDGTRELLADIARRDPRLTVILHEENRGFAAACNAGLAAATGEILVILNNDTVVPRGALSTLARHLAADPRLGLVGPVTNAVANAARIDAGYSDLQEMPAWAADRARAEDGKAFDIPMLALFCAALPRSVFEQVGPLDERFGLGMFEDDDYSRRVRAKGYAIRCAQDAFVHHWQMASFRKMPQKEYFALYRENQRKYEDKWGEAPRATAAHAWPTASGAEREDLAGVRERVAASRGAIIFLPSIGWGIHLVQRPHHLARVFAQMGYVSIFDCSNADDQVDGFQEIEPNLFLFRGSEAILHEVPSPLLWAFPYNVHRTEAFPSGARTVYDWIDDLSVFPYDPAFLERNHRRALQEATLVTCVARRLHEEALRVRADALYVPNGVEFERFASRAPPPKDEALSRFLSGGGPVAGYYGALARWFDDDLLEEAARLSPDWRFVLIGQQLDESLTGRPLLARDNVLWLGPRDYAALPGYLGLFDVATIPFRINAITLSTSPLKLFEYFAAGKPVVTTPMPECQAFREVGIAETARQFSDALGAAREKGREPAFRERLRELGRQNSWEARAEAVLERLGEARGGKARNAVGAPGPLR